MIDFKNRDKILSKILDEKLINNDKCIVNEIISFLKCKCHDCNKTKYHSECIRVIHDNDECEFIDVHKWRCDDCCANLPYVWCSDMCIGC